MLEVPAMEVFGEIHRPLIGYSTRVVNSFERPVLDACRKMMHTRAGAATA